MKTTVPGSIGGMKVAIAWPNRWLSGSRFRKRSGKNGRPQLRYFWISRFDGDDVGEDVPVGDDDALGLGRRPGGEDDLRDVVAADRHGCGRAARSCQSKSARRQIPTCGASSRFASGAITLPAQPAPRRRPARAARRRCPDPRERSRRTIGSRSAPRRRRRARIPRTPRSTPAGSRTRTARRRPCATPGLLQARGEARCRGGNLRVAVPPHSIPIVVDEELASGGGKVPEEIEQRLAGHAVIIARKDGVVAAGLQ